MRSAHTLKGASASVGLQAIKSVAHRLEEIFKVLYQPDILIDAELEGFLLKAYECLRQPLTAEFRGTRIPDAEILETAEGVFTEIYARLGDALEKETSLPTSVELGFDITQSIFEVGVKQRLDELALALENPDPDILFLQLSTQAEVFLGLAESLNLPGFGAIAQAISLALEAHPEQVILIAQQALNNLQQSQTLILAGDRTQGGTVSRELQAWIPAPLLTHLSYLEEDPLFSQETALKPPSKAIDSQMHLGVKDPHPKTPQSSRSIEPDKVTSEDISELVALTRQMEILRLDLEKKRLESMDSLLKESDPLSEELDPLSESPSSLPQDRDPLSSNLDPLADTVALAADWDTPNFWDSWVDESNPPETLRQDEKMLPPEDSVVEQDLDPVNFWDSWTDTDTDNDLVNPIDSDPVLENTALVKDELDPISFWDSWVDPESPGGERENPLGNPDQALKTPSNSTEALLTETVKHDSLVDPLTTWEGEISSADSPLLDLVSATYASPDEIVPILDPTTDSSQEFAIEQEPSPEVETYPKQLLEKYPFSLTSLNPSTPALVKNPGGIDSYLQPYSSSPAPEAFPSLEELLAGVENLESLRGATFVKEASSQPKPEIKPDQKVLPKAFIRVDVDNLETLNYLMGEMVTIQNQQTVQQENLHQSVQSLQERLQHYRRYLLTLQEGSDRLWEKSSVKHSDFDSLELDRYSEFQLILQTLLDESIQLEEAADAVALFSRKAELTTEKQQRILTQARDVITQSRMTQLGEVFQRFPRMIQQLAHTYQKPAKLDCQGEHLLVDKMIAEKLSDPLLHLLRNAFDHGIESSQERQQAGKSLEGNIYLHASQQGNRLLLEVRDDGCGINCERIRQKAVERGLFTAEAANQLTQAELLELLFKPGFSTATQLSDLSGRGIGLDVVRSQLQSFQGSVQVTFKPGQGTTFLLCIPLNQTIAQLLLCESAHRVYALITDNVLQLLLPRSKDVSLMQGKRVLRWIKNAQEILVPIYSLTDLLDYTYPNSSLTTASKALHPLVIIKQGQDLFALEVDHLLGEQELVIKPMDPGFIPPKYVFGCTLLGDGRLALVMDPLTLIQEKLQNELSRSHPLTPIKPASQALVQSSPHLRLPESSLPSLPSKKPLKVALIMDDSITVRQTLTTALKRAGYQVIQAGNGQEGLEQLRQEPDVQIILCDIEMPTMNGFEFLKYRQSDPKLQKIPVVMLTSRSGEKHRQLAAALGASDYLSKPYQEAELLNTLNTLITSNSRG
jgi:chemotaxis family two-component system sensor histidine kinase/response regulator PixL